MMNHTGFRKITLVFAHEGIPGTATGNQDPNANPFVSEDRKTVIIAVPGNSHKLMKVTLIDDVLGEIDVRLDLGEQDPVESANELRLDFDTETPASGAARSGARSSGTSAAKKPRARPSKKASAKKKAAGKAAAKKATRKSGPSASARKRR